MLLRWFKKLAILLLGISVINSSIKVSAESEFESNSMNSFEMSGRDTIVAYDSSTKGVSLVLNAVYNASLDAGYMVSANFTPTVTGLYYFETLRNNSVSQVDTYMYIVNSGGTVLAADDNSGENLYSAIGIKLTAGVPVTLKIRLKDSAASGAFYFQIRRQKANIFTFNYGDGVNTIPDANAALIYSDRMGYLAEGFENDITPLNADVSKIYTKFNSEILFFSGHGSPGSVYLKEIPDSDEMYQLKSNQLGSMKNTKLALWATCYSAAAGDVPSIANMAHQNGARVSIGWTDVTYVRSSKVFSDKFFEVLAQGYTVQEAMSVALTQFTLPYENLQKYAIYGDVNTILASPTIKPKMIEENSRDFANEFKEFIENSEYSLVSLTDNIDRYYKVFDGFLSGDFYDVYKNSFGEVIKIKKSGIDISDCEASTVLNTITVSDNNVPLYSSINDSNTQLLSECNYITILDGVLTPMHIEYYIVENIEYNYKYMDVVCRNMLDGSLIDYMDINTI